MLMDRDIKLITFNVDGLPEELDLSTLPWILKPIAWIYKLFKGTTIIKVNDNSDSAVNMRRISEYLKVSDADIIGVQEDFNYHDDLMSSLREKYNSSKFLGKIELSNLFSKIECWTHFPLPRFKCDGLNLITKKGINILEENIIRWKKSYGYFSHANDLLTHKGFRQYSLSLGQGATIDVYLVHMDADFYNEDTCPNINGDIKAREYQIKQVVSHILDRYNSNFKRPILIMGDTNSTNKYIWDTINIETYLLKPINDTDTLYIDEAIPNNGEDVDRVFIINNDKARYKIDASECYFDTSFGRMSDHKPLVCVLKLKENKL